jgi:UDP-N-acetyl-D-mannosaminuronate dehydrogenase
VAELPQLGLSSVDLDTALASADVAAIVTAHPSLDYQAVADAAPVLVDFRGVTRNIDAKNVVRL